MQTLVPALAALVAYLIGSLSFAVIVSRAMGLSDPRSYGSGNPGATNVLRSGNRSAAVLTLLLDALKGFAPVALVRAYGGPFGLNEGSAALIGLAAFVGHLWPIFFGFKGGKGVATAAGVLLGLNPALGGATLATWLFVAAVMRYSSLAALLSAFCAPFYQVLIWGGGPTAIAAAVMGGLLIWRHRANIRNLLQGTESRLGRKKAAGDIGNDTPSDAPAAPASSSHPHGAKR